MGRDDDGPYVSGIRCKDGYIVLGWSSDRVSNKQLRRIYNSYRNDSGFVDYFQTQWYRFYATRAEMKQDVSKLGCK